MWSNAKDKKPGLICSPICMLQSINFIFVDIHEAIKEEKGLPKIWKKITSINGGNEWRSIVERILPKLPVDDIGLFARWALTADDPEEPMIPIDESYMGICSPDLCDPR